MTNVPSNLSLIRYKEELEQGERLDSDCYAVFPTPIVILQDTNVGRLHAVGVDFPENLRPGDILFYTQPPCTTLP